MIIPDVNLLLYATVAGFPHHERARAWWQDVLSGPVPVGLASPAVFGCLRVATNGRVLSPPMSVTEALAHVRGWLAQPSATYLRPGPRHLAVCYRPARDAGDGSQPHHRRPACRAPSEEDAQLCSHSAGLRSVPGRPLGGPAAGPRSALRATRRSTAPSRSRRRPARGGDRGAGRAP
ncbi:MAG: TA system VapC family ribonuclease toxin [Chloroflexota bacterium]